VAPAVDGVVPRQASEKTEKTTASASDRREVVRMRGR
jgi:hypothetical protein